MKYESVQQAREALKKLEQTQAAYNHALGVLYLDATTAAPRSTSERFLCLTLMAAATPAGPEPMIATSSILKSPLGSAAQMR